MASKPSDVPCHGSVPFPSVTRTLRVDDDTTLSDASSRAPSRCLSYLKNRDFVPSRAASSLLSSKIVNIFVNMRESFVMNIKITEYERLARRRIRYITPVTASKVLAHPRYWSLPFLRLFLDSCDEACFHDPEAGYLLAQHAAELARRIPVREVGGYASTAERRDWRMKALAVWGSCCRAYGELTQAEAAYRLAHELTATAPGERPPSDDALGELAARQAVLWMSRGAMEKALESLDEAVSLFERGGNARRKADALTIRGLARYFVRDPDSLFDLVAALELVQADTPGGRRTLAAVLHNMALVISRGGVTTKAQEWAYKLLVQTKKEIRRPRSVQKIKITWLEGLLLVRLGITRLAEKRLRRAYEALAERRQGLETAAVALDLVCLYLDDGDEAAACRVAEEAYGWIRSWSDDPHLLAAAESWWGTLARRSGPLQVPVCFDSSKALQQTLYGLAFGRRWLGRDGTGAVPCSCP